jgi:putative DNA primase/helicase
MTFTQFAALYGLILPDLYPSDKIRRCATEAHPRREDGAYLWNGERGWVQDWSVSDERHWYENPNAKGFTQEDKRVWAERKRAREREELELAQRAAHVAAAKLKKCKPGEHPYLGSKKLGHVQGLVNEEHELLVPMRTVDTNHLVGVQTIWFLMEERVWKKKFSKGMRAKGAVFRLGNPRAAETWLVEGYATGLTVEMALRSLNANACVLVCFSAHNLTHVASQVKGRKFAFADNDKSGKGIGAVEAAKVPYCISPVEGEDANDWYVRAGLLPVAAEIMRLRRAKQD